MSLDNGAISNTIICNERKNVDLDALNLIASGCVNELCRCSYKNEKKRHCFVYDMDGAVSLAELNSNLSFGDVIELLHTASEMMQAINKYGLVLDNIKSTKEYIMKSAHEYKFIYVPIKHKSNTSIKDFTLKLISVVYYKDDRLAQFVKEMKRKKSDEQSLAFLLSFVSSYMSVNNISGEETSLLSDEGATVLLNQPGFDEEETPCTEPRDSDSSSIPEFNDSNIMGFSSFNFNGGADETTVLTAYGSTEFMPRNEKIIGDKILYLIRSLNGERIMVDVTPFKLGKDSVDMDFVLNNDSVSRHHATIVYEDSAYFITDNNSTNGTVVEGLRIRPEEKEEIDSGYIISLGNESFQAYIERR